MDIWKCFLRKQLSEAAQPESRMRSRVARRGKLQRDDYVVRMLRISRIFVVISWAKMTGDNKSKPFQNRSDVKDCFRNYFHFHDTAFRHSDWWLHSHCEINILALGTLQDTARTHSKFTSLWSTSTHLDEDFKHRRTVAVHIIRPMDGNIIQPDTDSHDFVLLLQQAEATLAVQRHSG